MLCPDSALSRKYDATVWSQPDPDSDSDDEGELVEEHAYSFQKIIGQLRLRAIAAEDDVPPPPHITAHQREHFDALLDFYFKGCEEFIQTAPPSPPLEGTPWAQEGRTVMHEGTMYGTLDAADVHGTSVGTHARGKFIQVPAGWELAPDSPASVAVIRSYPWGTHCMCVSNGATYSGTQHGCAGDQLGMYPLDGSENLQPNRLCTNQPPIQNSY